MEMSLGCTPGSETHIQRLPVFSCSQVIKREGREVFQQEALKSDISRDKPARDVGMKEDRKNGAGN